MIQLSRRRAVRDDVVRGTRGAGRTLRPQREGELVLVGILFLAGFMKDD